MENNNNNSNTTNRSSSRSRRYYYYDSNDYDNARSPNKHPRNHHRHHNNHRPSSRKPLPPPPPSHQDGPPSNPMATTTYRILCHTVRAAPSLSASVVKSVRQHTGAWINIHDLVPGDDERVIEISDTSWCEALFVSRRRRDPEGRMPSFSPAQEALFLIHERILECEAAYGGWGMEEEGGNRAVTRMVVSRMHVGSLLGKGGKIIEQMRMETKTHIRVLPRDHMLPRCIAMSEEIVQVVGDMNNVKSAIAIISSRLRESQHRDRSNSQTHNRDGLYNRANSPERFFPHEDEFIPHMNNTPRRFENYPSRPSGFGVESVGAHIGDNGPPISGDDIVFRILCPTDRVESVVGETDGFLELLQQEVGVDVKVVDRVAGSNEQMVIISSNEGPDDDLFPAQEALLHIQTRIVDLFPEKENIITTRLIVTSGEVGCLEGKDGSLSEMKRLTGATIQILPKAEVPACVSGSDELVQIVGEIKAAREAVVEVTSRLRSFICQEFSRRDASTPSFPAPSLVPSVMGAEETFFNNDPPAFHQFVQPAKEFGGSVTETVKQPEKERLNKISMPLVTRSILEVVLPEHAVPKLSKNKLSQISELSGANVKLVEDGPEVTEKVIQISGTPEQAERAQSLLQGFILSTQD